MSSVSSKIEPDVPSDGAILERAMSYGNTAIFTIELQRRRLKTEEPEDNVFILRYTIDFEFLVVALYRLKRSAELASKVPSVRVHMETAIKEFEGALPFLREIRNVGEHFDDYAVDGQRRRHKNVSRRQLQVSKWDGKTYYWLGHEVDIDAAFKAAKNLFLAIKGSLR